MTKKPIPSIHVPIQTENGSMELAWYLYLKSTGEGGGSSTIVDWDDITNKPQFATVATSGSYTDLSNRPTIPTVNDATITFTQGGVTKGTITLNQSSPETIALDSGGSGTDLPDQTGHSGEFLTTNGTSASWGAAPVTSVNSKTGAVTLTASDVGAATAAQGAKADTAVQPGDLATVATTGAYSDLTGTPTIPAAQVNSDWNASSGVAEILNKPTLGTMAAESANDYTKTSGLAAVATSGSYSDLNNKPTIPIVNNSTITFTQGGVTKGTITLNQSSPETIALDSGGGTTVPQSIDAEIVGTLTITDNSVVSGFSYNNYLKLPGVFELGDANSFEIVAAFVGGSLPHNEPRVLLSGQKPGSSNSGSLAGIQIYFGDGSSSKLRVYVFGNGANQWFTGITNLGTGKFYIKFQYNGSNYILLKSTDGVTYTQEINITATQLPSLAEYYIGGSAINNVISVDLAETYIKKNGQMIWTGMDAPGLHQKANIDLSNILTNIDYVVESQLPTAQNNYTWYRKYKSGWVEQGGLDGGSTQGGVSDRRVNIPITMSDANYYVNCQKTSGWDGAALSIQVGSRDTTGFSWSITYSASAQNRNICWEIKGMAA